MKEIRSFLDELVQMGRARWVDPQHIEVIQPHSCSHLRHFVTPKPESLIQRDSEQVTKASSPLRHSSSSSSPAATAQKPVSFTQSGLEQETTTSSPCSRPVATPKAESPTERVTTSDSEVTTKVTKGDYVVVSAKSRSMQCFQSLGDCGVTKSDER